MTVRKVGPKALALIEHFEGLRTRAYLCSAGVATIGIGSTRYADGRKVKLGETISADNARDLFAQTLDRDYGAAVLRVIGDAPTSAAQFGAMVSLAYNIGAAAFAKSTVAREHRAGHPDRAAVAFGMWTKAAGKVNAGLARRRGAEAALYRSDWPEVARLTQGAVA